MSPLISLLGLCARYGRPVLIVGLIVGIVWPELALVLKPWLPELIALMLFVAVLRLGQSSSAEMFGGLGPVLGVVALYQLFTPLILIAVFWVLGFSGPLAMAIVLMACGSSIAGSPNLVLLTGHDPAPAFKVLVLGTILLPFTVVPTFWFAGITGSSQAVMSASVRLLLVIAMSGVAAFLVRRFLLRAPSAEITAAIDGISALLMAIVVVGLMSAIGPALRSNPEQLAIAMGLAFMANFGLQMFAYFAFGLLPTNGARVAYSVIAGNRNMALFLTALPAAITDPMLLFIGCYQVPMYLTPVLLNRIYARKDQASD